MTVQIEAFPQRLERFQVDVVTWAVADQEGRQCCAQFPGGIHLHFAVPSDDPVTAHRQAGLVVNQVYPQVYRVAPAAAKRALCLAIGGGFDQ